MPSLTRELALRRRSRRLTLDDAVEIWKRHFLGEAQHHIAQAFGVNQDRINEILKEKRLVGSRQAAFGNASWQHVPGNKANA